MTSVQTTSAIVELEDGIFVIPGRKGGGCNVFVLKGKSKNLMIDSGLPSDFPHICATLGEIGLAIDDIHLVVLTHEHADHIGGIHQLPKTTLVAAHARAASKFLLEDQFSILSAAFEGGNPDLHVDIHLEDGMLIDIGGIQLRVLYTPGHCSGAICLLEPRRGILFPGDTLFTGGILGGIFASGNISDYISSLRRLSEFHLQTMYPAHGKKSTDPQGDIRRAINGSRQLMRDTQDLFEAMDARSSFDRLKYAVVDYSRRAAERRREARVPIDGTVLIKMDDADHVAKATKVSLAGIRLDREIPVAPGVQVDIHIEAVGTIPARVHYHDGGHTRLRFPRTHSCHDELAAWLEAAGAIKRESKRH